MSSNEDVMGQMRVAIQGGYEPINMNESLEKWLNAVHDPNADPENYPPDPSQQVITVPAMLTPKGANAMIDKKFRFDQDAPFDALTEEEQRALMQAAVVSNRTAQRRAQRPVHVTDIHSMGRKKRLKKNPFKPNAREKMRAKLDAIKKARRENG